MGFMCVLQLCLDLVQDWILKNGRDLMLVDGHGEMNVNRIANYYPDDGLIDLKMVIWDQQLFVCNVGTSL